MKREANQPAGNFAIPAFPTLVLELGDLSQGVCERNKFVEWRIIACPGKIWQSGPKKRAAIFRVRGEQTIDRVREEQTVDCVHVQGI